MLPITNASCKVTDQQIKISITRNDKFATYHPTATFNDYEGIMHIKVEIDNLIMT